MPGPRSSAKDSWIAWKAARFTSWTSIATHGRLARGRTDPGSVRQQSLRGGSDPAVPECGLADRDLTHRFT